MNLQYIQLASGYSYHVESNIWGTGTQKKDNQCFELAVTRQSTNA